jgi:hypothetical protein
MSNVLVSTDGGSPIEAQESFESLRVLAGRISRGATEVESYQRACKSLIHCLDENAANRESAEEFKRWEDRPKHEFLRLLLLQEQCPVRPFVFLHEVCSFASSGITWVMPAVARVLAPVIAPLLREQTPPVAGVLALLLLREFLSDLLTQGEISEIHLRNFHRFQREDLALPYSVIFSGHLYHRNRSDLLRAFADGTFNLEESELPPMHLLLVEWLSDHPLPAFSNPDQLLRRLAAAMAGARDPTCIDDNLAAGRTLASRHTTGEATIADMVRMGLKERLGAADDFHEFLSGLSGARSRLTNSLTGRRSALLRRLVGFKPYQAMHAVMNETRSRLGRGIALRRPPRVAICISGQLRGFRKAFATWKRKVLPGIECDIFVHAWKHIGNSGAEPFRYVLPFHGEAFTAAYREQCLRLSHETVKLRYPALFESLAGSGVVTEDELRGHYATEFVVLENDGDERFRGLSNSQKMHYKIHACSNLAVESGKSYDLVIRLRPDLPILHLGFGWRDLMRRTRSELLIMADSAAGVHYGNIMMGDQFAVGAPDSMRAYADTYSIYPALAAQRLFKLPPTTTGHVSLAYACWLHGITIERVPIKWLPLMDPQQLSSSTILGAVKRDAEGRDDVWDRVIIAAIEKDML